MKQLATFWSGTPYFVRGWFLGNLCYTVLAVLSFTSSNSEDSALSVLADLFALMIWPITYYSPSNPGIILYHIAWCLLGAVFVGRFGGSKGITILAGVMYIIGVLFLVCLFVAFIFALGRMGF